MPGRADRGKRPDQPRLGLGDGDAAADDLARAIAGHKAAMARLYAKGWRGWSRRAD